MGKGGRGDCALALPSPSPLVAVSISPAALPLPAGILKKRLLLAVRVKSGALVRWAFAGAQLQA